MRMETGHCVRIAERERSRGNCREDRGAGQKFEGEGHQQTRCGNRVGWSQRRASNTTRSRMERQPRLWRSPPAEMGVQIHLGGGSQCVQKVRIVVFEWRGGG